MIGGFESLIFFDCCCFCNFVDNVIFVLWCLLVFKWLLVCSGS